MSAQKMHADELAIDAALAARLVAAQFPDWAALPVEPVPFFGTDNAIYRLGEELVVRLPRRPTNAAQLEKELRWLPRLAPLLPLAVPVPVATGRPGEGYPLEWAVYRWLEGEPAVGDRLGDLRGVADDLTRFIAALQRIEATGGPPPGEHNSFRGVALATRDEPVRAAITSLGPAIDAGAVTAAWEAALAAPEWDRDGVWIHGDLDARNLLTENGRLSAVIDFGCLGVGDPACDVMVAWKLLSRETRELFRAALGVDAATWSRARGWALSQALIALGYYTLETNPVLVRESRRWLAHVLEDAADAGTD